MKKNDNEELTRLKERLQTQEGEFEIELKEMRKIIEEMKLKEQEDKHSLDEGI